MAWQGTTTEPTTIVHLAFTIAGLPASGIAGLITYDLRDPSGNVQQTGVTIVEQATPGYYDLTFTPDEAGNWLLTVRDPAAPDANGAVTDYWVQVVAGAAPAPPAGQLTTLNNLRERLQITKTDEDAYLTKLIDRATERCNSIVGYCLTAQDYTEFFDGDSTPYINLRHGPINSVTAVELITYDTTNGQPQVSRTLVEGVDYFVRGGGWKLPGFLEAKATFFNWGQNNYRVTYNAGWASVPMDVEEACLVYCVAMRNSRRDTQSSSRDVGAGSLSLNSQREVDDAIRLILAPYISLMASWQ